MVNVDPNWSKHHSSLRFLLVCLLLVGCSASNQQVIDTCRLFAVEDLETYVGNDLNKGLQTGVGNSCQYKSVKGTSVLLTVEPGVSLDHFEKTRSNLQNVQPINIAEKAFSYSSVENRLEGSHFHSSAGGHGRANSGSVEVNNAGADALIGDRRLRVWLKGPTATQALASQLLGDLAAVIQTAVKG